jgi:hypothetical protein
LPYTLFAALNTSVQILAHRNPIIVDDHFLLGLIQPVKAARVLDQSPSPGNRQSQEECIEARIVETFAQVSSCSLDHSFLVRGNACQLLSKLLALFLPHTTCPDNNQWC